MRFQAKKIAAGSTFCLASDNNKMLYLWGQTKPSGEVRLGRLELFLILSSHLNHHVLDSEYLRQLCTLNRCRISVAGMFDQLHAHSRGN